MPFYTTLYFEEDYYSSTAKGFRYPIQYLLGNYPGSSQDSPAPSAKWIKDNIPNVEDGYYWIDFQSIGPQLVYCIMNSNVSGGGWMSVNSTISPQISNTLTSSSWQQNSSNRLISQNNSILQVNISEVGCTGVSFYRLKSPFDWGVSYTETMLLMQRVNILGQCTEITGGTIAGWFEGPEFNGSYTTNGVCLWGGGIWASDTNIQNSTIMTNNNGSSVKLFWVFFGSGNNPSLNYSVRCGNGSGVHYHMWFVK